MRKKRIGNVISDVMLRKYILFGKTRKKRRIRDVVSLCPSLVSSQSKTKNHCGRYCFLGPWIGKVYDRDTRGGVCGSGCEVDDDTFKDFLELGFDGREGKRMEENNGRGGGETRGDGE